MCGNRVEELETRVQELEASVEGLTDELVESKVRIRELENAVDTDLGFSTDTRRSYEAQREERVEGADTSKPEEPTTDDSEEESAESSSKIIVA